MYNGDEVLRCPYNKHHTTSRSRFQRHLVKCEKNYPPDYRVICPYNATHRLSKSEIEEHINTCPMRNTVEASYIQPLSMHMRKSSEECNSTSEIDSDILSENQEEMRNIPKILPSSKLSHRTNGSIEGNVGSFVSTTNIGRGDLIHRYECLAISDESIRDDRESIVMPDCPSNHAEYHRRFKLREEKK